MVLTTLAASSLLAFQLVPANSPAPRRGSSEAPKQQSSGRGLVPDGWEAQLLPPGGGNRPPATTNPPAATGLTLVDKVSRVQAPQRGPFVRTADGKILTVTGSTVFTSDDGTRFTQIAEWPVFSMKPLQDKGLLVTEKGTIIAIWTDTSTRSFGWDKAAHRPRSNNKMECYAIRSTDNGKTWSSPIPLFTNGYCAQVRAIIQLQNGRIVTVLQDLDNALARQVSFTMVSDDEGQTWRRGETIDIGGTGITDGLFEAGLVETTPNNVLMVGRTSRDELYFGRSTDGLRFEVRPSGIRASSSPATVLKLKSGRILMAYNQERSVNGGEPRRVSGENSVENASWFRDELSLRWSDDNGKTWSDPQVIATMPGAQLAYLRLFEIEPGRIWIHSGVTDVRLEIREADFAR